VPNKAAARYIWLLPCATKKIFKTIEIKHKSLFN